MAPLDPRLSAAAAFVRRGAYLADIGTDHAYLPLHLLRQGVISRAVAADIGAGPLAHARAHVAAAGYAGAVTLLQTDGLCGLETYGITDIAICGMGGELIARILGDAPWVKDPAVRLILQPMTRPAALRYFLAENGFVIEKETVCRAAGRVYSCLCAVYTGTPYALSPAVAEVGEPTLVTEEEGAMFGELLARKIHALQKSTAAAAAAGRPNTYDETLLSALLTLQSR